MKEEQEKYNLPEGWAYVYLGDVLLLEYGKSLPKDRRQDGKYPVFGSNGIIGYHNDFLLEGPAIIIGRKGSVGSVHISIENCWPIDTTYFIKVYPSLDLKFIFHILKYLNLSQLDSSTTIPGLNRENVYKKKIALPTLSEQVAIVSQIDILFSKLDEAEQALKKANSSLKIYRQVLLNQAFSGNLTDEWRRQISVTESAKQLIVDIEKERQTKYHLELVEWENSVKKWKEIQTGQRPSRPSKPIVPDGPTDEQLCIQWKLPPDWEWTQLGLITFVTKLAGFEYTEYVKYTEKGDLPVIKAENAGPEGFKKTIYSKVLAESVEHLTRSQLNGNELIVVFIGAGVGNVATLPQGYKFFLGPNIAMARPYSGIYNKFLEYFYQSPQGKKLLLASAKAVAQPSLSMANIRQTPIAIPSKEEQMQVVQIIEHQFTITDNLEKTVNNILDEIIALKHSILKKGLEGRLVNYTSDESIEILLNTIQEEKRLYLENQKELNRNTSKQKKKMEEKKSILDILKESNSPISAQELWERSTSAGDIEGFYNEIKEIYHEIDELKSKTESLLTLKNENK